MKRALLTVCVLASSLLARCDLNPQPLPPEGASGNATPGGSKGAADSSTGASSSSGGGNLSADSSTDSSRNPSGGSDGGTIDASLLGDGMASEQTDGAVPGPDSGSGDGAMGLEDASNDGSTDAPAANDAGEEGDAEADTQAPDAEADGD